MAMAAAIRHGGISKHLGGIAHQHRRARRDPIGNCARRTMRAWRDAFMLKSQKPAIFLEANWLDKLVRHHALRIRLCEMVGDRARVGAGVKNGEIALKQICARRNQSIVARR